MTDTDTQLAPHSCDITGIRSHDRMLGKQMRQNEADESLVKARAGILCCHPPRVLSSVFSFLPKPKVERDLTPVDTECRYMLRSDPERTGLKSCQRDPFSTTQGESTLRNTLLFA